jgi:hypothetical protein
VQDVSSNAHDETDNPAPGPDTGDALSAATLHDLKSSLTVIRAHAQLARRRIGRMDHGANDPGALLASLAVIEGAVAHLSTRLEELRWAESKEEPLERADAGRRIG